MKKNYFVTVYAVHQSAGPCKSSKRPSEIPVNVSLIYMETSNIALVKF